MTQWIQKSVKALFLSLLLFPTVTIATEPVKGASETAVCKPFIPTLQTKTGSITLDASAVVEVGRQRENWISACSDSANCTPLSLNVRSSEGNDVTLRLEQAIEIERQRQLWIDDCADLLRPSLTAITTEGQTAEQRPDPGPLQQNGGLRQESRIPVQEPTLPSQEKPPVMIPCSNGYAIVSPSAPVIPSNVDRVIRAESEEDEGASVTLRWEPGFSGKTSDCVDVMPPDSYRICVFRGNDCYLTGARYIWDNIPAGQTQMTVTVPRGRFQGSDFHWAVLACSDESYCGDFSLPQPMRYQLPPPTFSWVSWETNDDNPEKPFSEITVRWSSVYQAELYYLCLKTYQRDVCEYLKTRGTSADPYIKHTKKLRYIIDDDLRQFRGQSVTYAVAACTSADEPTEENCSYYQRLKTFNYPDPK